MSNKHYFLSSFFWSTLSKILNAIFGFVSVPILLGYFGKADYGLLSIATACNGCMHLLDLGMNTGAVKFFSQWLAEGKRDLIQKVSNTNTTFYLIISTINIVGLLALAWFGEDFFSVSHDQFLKLRSCFYILVIFASVSWATSAYTQLLTAFKKIAFTMQVNSVMILLRIALIFCVLYFKLSLIEYFFYLTAIVAATIIPYIVKCKREKLLDSLKPAMYWKEFKVIFYFSLSIFALSLFQIVATQSRPIVLSMFAENGAESVADFRIVEVIPQFIIMLCGSLTAIFLPNSSQMVVKNDKSEIQSFVNVWTTRTTIFVCVLCFPFIVASKEILSAYVGADYAYLSKWLMLWCFFLIVQMHSTPAFSFILAKGRTKVLVVSTAIASVISIVVNICLSPSIPVGSAVIGYSVYMLCLIGVYYFYIYKYYIGLQRLPVVRSFMVPLVLGCCVSLIPFYISIPYIEISSVSRINYIFMFAIKSILWLLPYFCLLILFRVIKVSDFKGVFNGRNKKIKPSC